MASKERNKCGSCDHFMEIPTGMVNLQHKPGMCLRMPPQVQMVPIQVPGTGGLGPEKVQMQLVPQGFFPPVREDTVCCGEFFLIPERLALAD